MIGLVQKVLVEVLEDAGGEDLKRRVFDAADVPVDSPYRIDRNYDDAECKRLIEATRTVLDVPMAALMETYGRAFFGRAHNLFPRFFQLASNSREFLMRQPSIHASIGAGLRDDVDRKAVNDKFHIDEGVATGGQVAAPIHVTYQSPSQLCDLYRSLAHIVADYYGDKISIDVEDCRKRGCEACRMRVEWLEIAPPGTSRRWPEGAGAAPEAF